MSADRHAIDALTDFVDERLDANAREAVERHLLECDSCRREVELARAAKRAMARLPGVDMPPDFASRLDAALRAERLPAGGPAAGRLTTGDRPLYSRRWLIGLGAGAAAAAATFLFWRRSPGQPESVAETTIAYRLGRLPLTIALTDAEALGAELTARVGFQARVFDLGMMGYTIRGGRVHDVAGARSAMWVYTGAAGELVCQMYLGRVADLPPAAEVRSARGFTFHVYHAARETQVFWQEGSVVCVLSSNLPPEDVIGLAIEKAMLS